MEPREMELKTKKEVKTGTGEETRKGPVFLPAVDIFENTNELVILADMPGVDGQAIDIDLKDNQLTIQGRIEPPEGGREVALYKEYNWGDYFRQFNLSEVIDQARITARMENGVLRLILPKVEKVKPHKIQVSAG
jgi:HSP20 family protein